MDYSEDKSCMSRKSQESISCRAISFLTAIYIFKKHLTNYGLGNNITLLFVMRARQALF